MNSARVKAKPPSRRGQSRGLDPQHQRGAREVDNSQRLKREPPRDAECASRQNSSDPWEPIFFIAAQPVDASRQNRPGYDERASGPIIYAYVGGNPISYTDPEGLNPAAAVYRAGMTGYRIGEAINPYVQPYIASGLNALLLPDFNDPSIILAQNNKQTRRRIDGLQERVDEHNNKLNQEPNCPASNHWRNEINVWQSEIDRLRLRLPNGK